MSKYTPATALAIKRDIQTSQEILAGINVKIDIKRKELQAIDGILETKRGLLARFEDAMVGVFSRGLKQKEQKEKRISELDLTISKLETARDLLTAEIQLRKEDITEPVGAMLVQSLISQLEPILDKLLLDINASENELKLLAEKKHEFIIANAELEKEASTQEEKVKFAELVLAEIDRTRNAALRQLARERQQLYFMAERKQASKIMQARLTNNEFQTTYEQLPRRGSI